MAASSPETPPSAPSSPQRTKGSPQPQTFLRQLPNPYAVISPRLIFTTLSPRDVHAGPYAHPTTGKHMHLFTLDQDLVYIPFKHDHGPLNLAYTFDACVMIYDKLNSKDNKRRLLCLYTKPDAESKSNLALISALYRLIVEHHDPWDAYQPLAHLEVIPFRDAGNGVNEYALSIQDVLYGIWKAQQFDILRLHDFDAEEYRYYEKVENGDLNILGDFIAFASPMDASFIRRQTAPGLVPPTYTSSQRRMMVTAFEKVITKFSQENVGLVIRLNDELYDRSHFIDMGIEHMEMYFDDGTNPTDEMVREFIQKVDHTINISKRRVAVHCKAGLGRTGVLIGAYLIYKHGFTASEVIGYMRVVRPGMVVGPQQRYMQLNQLKWAGWAAIDKATQEVSKSLPSPPMEIQPALPSVTEAALCTDSTPSPLTPTRRVASAAANGKHGDAVGQPRKGVNGTSVVEESAPAIQQPTTPRREPRETTIRGPQSTASSSDSSVRGVKRGAGRMPVPAPVRGEQLTSQVRSSNTIGTLSRSASNTSCSSSASELDKRATKRTTRPGDSSPMAKSGLSSPPPSRESTPVIEIPTDLDDFESPMTPKAQTAPLSSPAPTPKTPTAPRGSRSMIPRRGKDSPQAQPTLRVARYTHSTHQCHAQQQAQLQLEQQMAATVVEDDGDSSSTASSFSRTSGVSSVAQGSTRRSLLSAPKSWTSLTRLGTVAAPATSCEDQPCVLPKDRHD